MCCQHAQPAYNVCAYQQVPPLSLCIQPALQQLLLTVPCVCAEFVHAGGRYLGLCAGAYYGCARVVFEPGTPLEVVGDRELAFFPGIARGAAFPGEVQKLQLAGYCHLASHQQVPQDQGFMSHKHYLRHASISIPLLPCCPGAALW